VILISWPSGGGAGHKAPRYGAQAEGPARWAATENIEQGTPDNES
jgi:hypothetical protein